LLPQLGGEELVPGPAADGVSRQWQQGAVADCSGARYPNRQHPAVVNGRYQLRVDTDVFTVDGTSGSVGVRRGTADRPHAALTTDAGTIHAVALGNRPIADAVQSGDLRLDGDQQAITGLTSLLQALSRPAGRTGHLHDLSTIAPRVGAPKSRG